MIGTSVMKELIRDAIWIIIRFSFIHFYETNNRPFTRAHNVTYNRAIFKTIWILQKNSPFPNIHVAFKKRAYIYIFHLSNILRRIWNTYVNFGDLNLSKNLRISRLTCWTETKPKTFIICEAPRKVFWMQKNLW